MRGPIYKSNTQTGKDGIRTFYRFSESYRMGDKGRIKPLPYYMVTSQSSDCDAPNAWAAYYGCSSTGWGNQDSLAKNKALDKFKGAMNSDMSASLAITLAEWKQSEKMIVARAGQLMRAYSHVRKFRLFQACAELGVNASGPVRKRFKARQAARDVSGAWLELHFGWSPLVSDIHAAVDIMQSPMPDGYSVGKGSSTDKVQIVKGFRDWSTYASIKTCCRVSAYVSVSNPNLALANRLGLVNPAAVAWELVPFSFVVDWFLPVSKFLNSFSDFVGYDLKWASTTIKRNATSTQMFKQDSGTIINSGTAAYIRRSGGIPSYTLTRPPFKGFSPTRGATAIALVLQKFLHK